jgi:hypothetical protein
MMPSNPVGPLEGRPPFLWVAAAFLFSFVCFFPNPALPLGDNTGLQAGQILALLSLPFVLISGLPKRQTLVLLLLLLPMLVSGYLVVLTGRALSNEIVLKSTIATVLVFLVLVPAGKVANKRYALPLLSGLAWGVMLNVAVGLYQVYSFARDEFPLPGLYQNPSFGSSITEDPESYALYVKRPFGIFPEASAMAASIGPWLVLIVGLLLYPKLRHGMTRGLRVQLLLATVSGVALILLSSSGFTVWLLISLLLVGLPALKDWVLRLHRPGSLIAMIAFVLIGVALVYFSLAYVGSRLDIQENSSWSARLASIVWGISYLGTSPAVLLFGVGPGQSTLLLQSPEALNLLPESSGELAVTAVWSIVVHYVQEMGLLGAVALALTLIMVLRAIVRSSARLVGFSCLLAWLAGVILTTSYLPMLPIWLLLGVLLNWDRLFEVRASEKGLGPDVSVFPEVVKT